MFKRKTTAALLMALASLLSGCKIVTAGVVTVAAATGLAGYVVYKTGDVAVTGVGKAAQATGDAVSSGSKSVATVIFADNELRTEYAQNLRTTWAASNLALQKANFRDVRGTFDALSGELSAQTLDNMAIVIKMKSLTPQSTEARIRVGVKGDMKAAELIHSLLLREFPAPAAPLSVSTPRPEVRT